MTDAFGLVAMVAMTPLVTIQLLGLAGRVQKNWKTTLCGRNLPERRTASCIMTHE